jgi:hypothetical protein
MIVNVMIITGIVLIVIGLSVKLLSLITPSVEQKFEDIFHTIIFILFFIVVGGWLISLISWVANLGEKK